MASKDLVGWFTWVAVAAVVLVPVVWFLWRLYREGEKHAQPPGAAVFGKWLLALGLLLAVGARGYGLISDQQIVRARAIVAEEGKQAPMWAQRLQAPTAAYATRSYICAWVFVIGSGVILFGLMQVVMTGTTPERLAYLGLVGLLLFSLFVYGDAW